MATSKNSHHLNGQEKLDYFSAGRPVHLASYCAFLDVLGFTNRVTKSYVSGVQDDLLGRFHDVLSAQINSLKDNCDESMLYFKSFSDNIVIAHPRFSEDMENEFAFVMWGITDLQMQMALNGFFIRGGLSLGQLFMDQDHVYGEALINSYELENSVAVDPVVILCDEAKAMVDYHVNFYAPGSAPQLRSVLVRPDGKYFLNYLTECITHNNDEGEYLVSRYIFDHKEQIEKALIDYVEIPKVFSKFSWLAAYHNYFCDLFSWMPKYDESMKVVAKIEDINFTLLNGNKYFTE